MIKHFRQSHTIPFRIFLDPCICNYIVNPNHCYILPENNRYCLKPCAQNSIWIITFENVHLKNENGDVWWFKVFNWGRTVNPCGSTLAIKKLCQRLSDSCRLNNILCPSFCPSLVLRSSWTRFLVGLTMLLTHVVESAACTYDGGDVHIQPFSQAPPSPL